VAILNLIRLTIPIVLLNIFFNFSTSSAQINDLKNSFFPLIPGSYWVTQDTFFSREAEIAAQEGGMNPFSTKTDSVKNVSQYNGGYHVTIKHKISSSKKAIEYEWFIDKVGSIYETMKKKDSLILESILWKTHPTSDDTVYEYGIKENPLVYEKGSSDSLMLLIPKWQSKNEQSSYLFKKGIGLIGQIYPTTANRLIEYRIGNGPIIKKHWLMEAPKGK